MPDADKAAKALEARALALLARREYTRMELARRLARAPARGAGDRPGDADAESFDDDADGEADGDGPGVRIEALLDALTARGLLSDARAAEAIVHVRASQRGLLRVRQELEQKGVSADIAAAATAGLQARQLPLAREVWRKRFGVLPKDAAERARQARFLAARGFAFEVIRAVLGGDEAD